MYRFRTILVAALLGVAVPAASAGCKPPATVAPEDQAAFQAERALLITKIVVEQAHKGLWSDPLRQKAAECEGQADVRACMGHFTPENNRKIVQALEVYAAAARVAGDVVLRESDAQGAPELKGLVLSCVDAGLTILGLIPGSEKYIPKLESLKVFLQ